LIFVDGPAEAGVSFEKVQFGARLVCRADHPTGEVGRS